MGRRGSAWWVSLELVLRAVLALQALVATQRLWMVTSSVARRARLIAAARSLKSAFTFARADTGASAAAAASHQMADVPLDLRAGGLVVGLPRRICLAFASAGEFLLVRAETDRPPG